MDDKKLLDNALKVLTEIVLTGNLTSAQVSQACDVVNEAKRRSVRNTKPYPLPQRKAA